MDLWFPQLFLQESERTQTRTKKSPGQKSCTERRKTVHLCPRVDKWTELWNCGRECNKQSFTLHKLLSMSSYAICALPSTPQKLLLMRFRVRGSLLMQRGRRPWAITVFIVCDFMLGHLQLPERNPTGNRKSNVALPLTQNYYLQRNIFEVFFCKSYKNVTRNSLKKFFLPEDDKGANSLKIPKNNSLGIIFTIVSYQGVSVRMLGHIVRVCTWYVTHARTHTHTHTLTWFISLMRVDWRHWPSIITGRMKVYMAHRPKRGYQLSLWCKYTCIPWRQ